MDRDQWKENYIEWRRSLHTQLCKAFTILSVCSSFGNMVALLEKYRLIRTVIGAGSKTIISVIKTCTFVPSLYLCAFQVRGEVDLQSALFSYFLFSELGTLPVHIFSVEMLKWHLLELEVRYAQFYILQWRRNLKYHLAWRSMFLLLLVNDDSVSPKETPDYSVSQIVLF